MVGIIITYLVRTEREHLKKYVYQGLVAAIAGSIGVAFLFARIAINEETFEGIVMWLAAGFITSMIIWMWKTGKKIRKNIEQRVERYSTTGQILGLFFFTFLMVLREGVETVLFLGALTLETNPVLSVGGASSGILLAVVFAILFIRGSLRINLSKFFLVTGLILLIIVVQLIISGYHELAEVGIIPASPREMSIIGPIVKNEALFIMAIIAIPLLTILVDLWRRKPSFPQGLSSAQRRKLTWKFKQERRWKSLVVAVCLTVLALLGGNYVGSELPARPPVEEIEPVEGKVKIPIQMIPPGQMKMFKIQETRFFLFRQDEDDFAVNLDACLICGEYGYYQRGKELICRNCDAPINVESLNIGGGCNPIPVDFSLERGKIKIDVKNLGL